VVRDLSKNKENRINQLKDLQRRSFENLEEIMRQSVSPKKNLRAVLDKQLPLSTAQKATLKSAKVSPPKQQKIVELPKYQINLTQLVTQQNTANNTSLINQQILKHAQHEPSSHLTTQFI